MKPFNEPLINEMSAFIKEYQLDKGVSPSYSVISTRFRISKSVVARYLKQLEMRGMLRKNDDGVIAIDTRLFKGKTKPTSLVGAVASSSIKAITVSPFSAQFCFFAIIKSPSYIPLPILL